MSLREKVADKIETHIPDKFEFNVKLADEIISIVIDEATEVINNVGLSADDNAAVIIAIKGLKGNK